MSLVEVTGLLQQSLSPITANQAGHQLRTLESTPGFPIVLLSIIESDSIDQSIRLASVLYFKNLLNRKWTDMDGNYNLNLNDVENIKNKIIKLMIELNNDNLKIQIGECISVIANSDFPNKWTNLMDELVENLKTNDLKNINGVLMVAHSIFKRWRPLFASDELYLEIKFVIDKFSQSFLDLFIQTDKLIDSNLNNKEVLQQLFNNLLILIKIYYDFNCQDIPEFFEDNLTSLMEIVYKYLIFQNDLLIDKNEDEEVDILTKTKGSICDLIQLYSTRYQEFFDPFIKKFIESCWNQLTLLTMQIKYDILTSKFLTFLTSIIKIPKYFDIFNNSQVLNEIFLNIILPNITIRESDEELFEDDPIEYIKRDVENNDTNTRRSASTEFLRELKDKNESLVTETVMKYIETFLKNYDENQQLNWKQKDTAIYLFIAIAAKGNITNAGVSSTNLLVDVVSFFQQSIANNLVSGNNSIHPILIVDSIRYLYIFRNQLTKEQLIESFPLLLNHLDSNNYNTYTYSSITIERILSIKNNNQLLFNQKDIEPIFKDLVTIVFKKILINGRIPEKLSENDYLMKCLMRILILNNDNNSRKNFEFVGIMINELVEIIETISKNPSNPKFNHYCFESVGIIINYNHNNDLKYIYGFMDLIIPKLLKILSDDVSEFIPYIIQLLSFLLELYNKYGGNELPSYYKNLVKPILSPTLWELKGNIPSNTRLIIDIIETDSNSFNENLIGLLGIFQKLISSKLNDNYGFDLLETILMKINLHNLNPYLNQLATLLLTRLQNLKTDKYVKRFIIFFSKISLIDENYLINHKSNLLGPVFTVKFIDQLQENLFGNIFKNFFLPNLKNFLNPIDKKIIILGLTNLITKNQEFIDGNYSTYLIETLNEIFKLIFQKNDQFVINEQSDILNDFEKQEFGANFSKLIIIGNKKFDPVDNISVKEIQKIFLVLVKQFVENHESIKNNWGQLDPILINELSNI